MVFVIWVSILKCYIDINSINKVIVWTTLSNPYQKVLLCVAKVLHEHINRIPTELLCDLEQVMLHSFHAFMTREHFKNGSQWLYSFPSIAITNYHTLGGLEPTEMYSLTVLEARSSKSGCQQGHILSNVLESFFT